MQEETQQQKLGERGLGDILNETFAVYGRRFKKLVALTAVVYLPLLIIPLLLLKPGDPNAESATMVDMVMMVIVVVAGMISYGAMTSAVGQHYVLDEVSVSGCYTRLLWRAVSILLLVSLAVLLLMLVFAPLLFTSQDGPSPLVLFSLAILVVFIAYWVYQTSMIPAVTVEGYRFSGAMRRGFKLARGSEFRILGHLIVYVLVGLGLAILIVLPFLFMSVLVSGEELSLAGGIAQTVGFLVAGVLVQPVTLIATTLLYYDLRVRKEGYDMSRLSLEMGVAPA